MCPSAIPRHSIGRSQRGWGGGLTRGSMHRTDSVQISNIRPTYPQRAGAKILSDFNQYHVDSLSLSTVKGNTRPSQTSPTASPAFLASPDPRVEATRGVVLYQTAVETSKRQSARRGQDPENLRVNFFRVVAKLKQCAMWAYIALRV